MVYVGSKRRVAKHLLPIILAGRRPGQVYVEPFVGGCNMIDKVDGPRIGADANPYLIALWQAIVSGWVPPTEFLTREQWQEIKENKEKFPPELVGFVGFGCSFGGKWFGGYAFDSAGTNRSAQSSRSCVKQAASLVGVTFVCSSYDQLAIPRNSIVYCDPPYSGDTSRSSYFGKDFDHRTFWEWVRAKTQEGHRVFVSEYAAPEDFQCVAEVPFRTVMDRNRSVPRVERLFSLRQG